MDSKRPSRLRSWGPDLPCPGVSLPPEWLRRVQRLTLQVASVLERREGAGRRGAAGVGQEFVGYRPYRAGEDLRQLDWGLLARLGKPFVRVTRQETAELWTVFLDASRSMGCGPPGKLQAAAELCGGIVGVGLHQGAQVEVLASGDPEPKRFLVRRRGDLPGLVQFLGTLRAEDRGGLKQLLDGPSPRAGRVFVIGDLFDLEPQAVLKLLARGRELLLLQVLAPEELAPTVGESVDWRDPEGDGRRRVRHDPEVIVEYERALEEHLERWGRLAEHPTVSHLVHASGTAFEETLGRVLIP